MLRCNEIRLGNHVLVRQQVKKITLINNDAGFTDVPLIGFDDDEDNYIRCDDADVSPIPLSDDVLRQCGFVFHDYFRFWQFLQTDGGPRSEMDIDLDFSLIDFLRRPIVKKITSLHQLQNLFFALKGTELPYQHATKVRKEPIPETGTGAVPPHALTIA